MILMEPERICLLVVVDVTLSSRVNGLGCLESNSDKVLTENVVEDTGAETTVLLELWGGQCMFQSDRDMKINLRSR